MNEETLGFVGMILSADDNNNNEPESDPDDIIDNEPEQEPIGFDVNNPGNIFATALHQAALARTLSEAGAESWFEAVNMKFKICNFRNATVYQELFGLSGGQASTPVCLHTTVNLCSQRPYK